MGTVSIGHEFFVKERKSLYSNWQRDFFREFIQNSVDAGSRNISISVEESVENGILCEVSVTDDGCGMTRQILENVYFALGETTKTGDGVGGFGRARILTCFSHPGYTIHTQDVFVNGSGSTFEIEEAGIIKSGTKVQVYIGDATAEDMLFALRDYLSSCQLSGVNITINGDIFNDWLYRRNKVRELSFGTIHVNKSGRLNKVFFRVHGQFMFSRYTNANAQVVVEIDPSRSRDVLDSSRGGLMGSFQQEVDKFLTELSIDTRSALRPRVDNSRMIINDGGWIRSGKRSETVPREEPAEQSVIQNTGAAGTFEIVHNEHEVIGTVPGQQSVVAAGITINAEVPDSSFDEQCTGGEGEIPLLVDLFNIYLLDETGRQSFKRVIDQYDPRSWVHKRQWIKDHGYRRYRKGVEHLKLALAWKICCEAAVDALLDQRGGEIAWTVGWVFSDYIEGAHRVVDGGHIYMMRPVDMANGKSAWRLTKDMVVKMIALANHEVAHTTCSAHDEDYAGTLTEISGVVDQAKIWRRIREEVKGL